MSITVAKNKPNDKQIILSCMIGNALEWYDFVIYGYFASLLGALFFPTFDPFTQTLASWGVFWSGFLVRPLGAIVFGYIGDKVGRKTALSFSIYVMTIPTALIGCLPTYEQIDIFAPLLLILMRSLQGFAMGGEYTGAVIFLTEHAKPGQRGIWGSWANFSVVIGVIIGSLVATLSNTLLPQEIMVSWGWRLPFIFSVVGGIVGAYIRRHLVDPAVFLAIKEIKDQAHIPVRPLRTLFLEHKAKLGHLILLDFLTAIGFYMVTVFMATYFKTHLNLEGGKVFFMHTMNMVLLAIFIFLGGSLTDRIGRKRVLAYACFGVILLSFPLFQDLQLGSYKHAAFAQMVLAVMVGLFLGAIPISLSEIMPMSVRYSGVSLGHNLSMSIFGGSTPLIVTELIKVTHDLKAPAYLLIAAAVLSLIAVYFLKSDITKAEELRNLNKKTSNF